MKSKMIQFAPEPQTAVNDNNGEDLKDDEILQPISNADMVRGCRDSGSVQSAHLQSARRGARQTNITGPKVDE